jgi:methyltransferase FkbM-like protein
MVNETVDVPLTTVDALIARHGLPAFAKIDVEGYEEAVLAGMQQPVAQFSFELHSADLSAAKRCAELVRRPETQFNLSWGESMSFALSGWVDADELRREFDRIAIARRGELLHGDVYVRHRSLLAAPTP